VSPLRLFIGDESDANRSCLELCLALRLVHDRFLSRSLSADLLLHSPSHPCSINYDELKDQRARDRPHSQFGLFPCVLSQSFPSTSLFRCILYAILCCQGREPCTEKACGLSTTGFKLKDSKFDSASSQTMQPPGRSSYSAVKAALFVDWRSCIRAYYQSVGMASLPSSKKRNAYVPMLA
jgi:hypothetical protein